MKNLLKILIILTVGAFIATGCSSNATEVEVKMKSQEEQMEILNTYKYEDYKKIYDAVLIEVEHFETEDSVLKKWLIRTLAAEKLYYENDLTDDQVLGLAKQAMEEDKAWKELANDKYNVTVSEEEIDTYISGLPNLDLPQTQAYADALGLTIEELNATFDRDIYEKNAIWLKLKPKLEEKYDTDDNNLLIKKYEAEVRR